MPKRIEIWNARSSAKRFSWSSNKHHWHLDAEKVLNMEERYEQIEQERKVKEENGII